MELTKEVLLSRLSNEWAELKQLIQSQNNYYGIHMSDKRSLIVDEVNFNGRQFLIIINSESGDLKFVDDLVHFDRVSNFSDKDLDFNEWKQRHDKLLNEVEKTGFVLRSAGTGGNDDYLWYELSIKADQFTIGKLEKATKLWTHYNKMSRNLIDE